MRKIKLQQKDEVLNAIEEAWTDFGAIALYPHDVESDTNMFMLLTAENIKDNKLINQLYSNEDIIFIDSNHYEQDEVVKYQNQIRDYFKQLRDDIDKDKHKEIYNMYNSILIELEANKRMDGNKMRKSKHIFNSFFYHLMANTVEFMKFIAPFYIIAGLVISAAMIAVANNPIPLIILFIIGLLGKTIIDTWEANN